MSKKTLTLSFVIILLVVLAVPVYFYKFSNRDALWKIVNEQCVPNYQSDLGPAPCLTVNPENDLVTFKDRKGAFHYLVMPIQPITGVESSLLQEEATSSYFHYAWLYRDLLRLPDDKQGKHLVSVAVNSRYGRSQDHLHLHIACLDSDVQSTLLEAAAQIDTAWKPLPSELKSHRYLARKISAHELESIGPFRLLTQDGLASASKMGHFGLAMTHIGDHGFILLATQLDIGDFNLSSAGRLQDYDCQ